MGRLTRPCAALIVAVAFALLAGPHAPVVVADAAAPDSAIGAFVASYGDPPQATEGRLRIPSIDVDAAIGAHTVDADGYSPMPYGPADVAWYDFGAFPGLGGIPGGGGNAVFSGHVDYVAHVRWAGPDVRYDGPGVFARLGEVAVGDPIEVVRNGETLRYAVSWTLHVDAAEDRWAEYWNASLPVDSITLYTCAGQFDSASVSYSDRVIVRAERVIGTPRQLTQTNGDYTAGISGTNSPALLAAAQPFPVNAIWKPVGEDRYLFWAPGAPPFVNSLNGHLLPQDFVILKIR